MLALALLPILATLAAAHPGCGGHELVHRNPGYGSPALAARQATESSAAVSLDVGTECTAYGYAPVTSIMANYPPIWTVADIVSGDTAATNLFATINNTLNTKLPVDVPHGTITGDWTGVVYNATDPNCWWTWSHCTTPAASTGLSPDITTVPEPETWGFGFDDGPNCSHNALYDYLQEQNQKATMFYIGSNIADWPLQALRGIADGHQICVHTWSHRYMTALTNSQAFAELYYTRQLIKDILGVTPLCWRPPYGDVDNRIRMIAASLNMTTIVWSDDTSDWKAYAAGYNITQTDVDANYQAIINKVSNNTYVNSGPVVLNHELNNFTMSEMMTWYPKIKAAFKYIVPIATAYNWTQPYAESSISYPDFATYIAGNIDNSTSSSAGTTPAGTGAGVGSTNSSLTGTTSGTGSSSSSSQKASGTTSSTSSTSSKASSAGNLVVPASAFVGVVGAVVAFFL